jgi:hypothetical protein
MRLIQILKLPEHNNDRSRRTLEILGGIYAERWETSLRIALRHFRQRLKIELDLKSHDVCLINGNLYRATERTNYYFGLQKWASQLGTKISASDWIRQKIPGPTIRDEISYLFG